MRTRSVLLPAMTVLAAFGCGPPLAATTSSGSSGGSSGSGNGSSSAGTGSGTGSGTAAGTAPVAVSMTDAPFPYPLFNRMSVWITKVELQGSNGSFTTLADWSSNAQGFEIMGLQNGQTTSVIATPVPQGSYQALRVTMPTLHAFLTDGTPITVTADNGGVLLLPLELDAGQSGASILFDLDVAQSVQVQAESSNHGAPATTTNEVAGVTFSPVGRAAVAGSGGSLSGTVTNSDGSPAVGATVEIASGTTFKGDSSTDANGDFAFLELPP